MNRKHWAWGAALALSALLNGCGKKPAMASTAPPPASPGEVPRDTEREAAERRAREAAAAQAAAASARREAEQLRAVLEARVFFDYDEADLRGDARGALEDKARALRDHPTIRMRVEGHADERGSTEYNLALGARRAQSVVEYLAGFGIAATRLETVSLGEEKPLEGGHEDRAWSRNRRAEFLVTGGTLNEEAPR